MVSPDSNGFKELGSVNSTNFPDLASIPAGTSVDVYIEWTPNAALTADQIAAGVFYFHSCLRIRIDHLSNETIFGNQDGDGQKEGEVGFLAGQTAHAEVQEDGSFRGAIPRGEFRIAACLFAGTETLSSAIEAPVLVR